MTHTIPQVSTDSAEDTTQILRLAVEMKKFVLEELLDKLLGAVPSKLLALEAVGNELKLTSTSTFCSALVATDLVSVRAQGRLVVSAEKLLAIVKSADEGDLSLKQDSHALQVAAGNAVWKISTHRAELESPEYGDLVFYSTDRDSFLDALDSVKYAATSSANNPVLRALHVKNRKITASDGIRLQQIPLGDEFPDLDFKLPVDVVPSLDKFLSASKAEFGLSITGNGSRQVIVFNSGYDMFTVTTAAPTELAVEEYLLRPLLSNTSELLADRQELLEAIARISINSDRLTNSLVLKLSKNSMVLEACDNEGNKATETIDVLWGKKPTSLTVNHLFLSEMLETYKGKICYFYLGESLKSKKSPLLLKGKETGSLSLLQQMKV